MSKVRSLSFDYLEVSFPDQCLTRVKRYQITDENRDNILSLKRKFDGKDLFKELRKTCVYPSNIKDKNGEVILPADSLVNGKTGKEWERTYKNGSCSIKPNIKLPNYIRFDPSAKSLTAVYAWNKVKGEKRELTPTQLKTLNKLLQKEKVRELKPQSLSGRVVEMPKQGASETIPRSFDY